MMSLLQETSQSCYTLPSHSPSLMREVRRRQHLSVCVEETGGVERLAVGEVCLGNLVRKQCSVILMPFEHYQFQGSNLFLLHCTLAS